VHAAALRFAPNFALRILIMPPVATAAAAAVGSCRRMMEPAAATAAARGGAQPQPQSFRYLMLNKPAGCVCSRQVATGRDTPTVYAHLEAAGFPTDVGHVGRLDVPTEGLLLFTDDGLLLQALTNHSPTTRDGKLPAWAEQPEGAREIVKVYLCEIAGREPTDDDLELMQQPYTYGKGRGAQRPADKQVTTLPAQVRVVDAPASSELGSTWVEVRIMEGRNRQVRRLCQRSRLPLRTLRRVALGPICLGDLPEGHVRWLTADEVTAACNACLPGRPVPQMLTNGTAQAASGSSSAEPDPADTTGSPPPRKRANMMEH
jgi:pseudouridine synthase